MKSFDFACDYTIEIYCSDNGKYHSKVTDQDHYAVFISHDDTSRDEVYEAACNWVDKEVERRINESET